MLAELRRVMERVVAQEISADQARVIATTVIEEIGAGAMVMGTALTGLDEPLTSQQKREVSRLAEDQGRYFGRFMASLEASMSPDQRLLLYGGVVDQAFWRGAASSLPSRTAIHWRLGVAEHCADCLELAGGGPYTAPGEGGNPLPTVPRAGDTRCLGNCRCHLEVEGSIEVGLVNHPGIEVMTIGGIEVDPLSPGAVAAAQLYRNLVERYAWHLRMSAARPGSDHAAIAQRLRQEIEAMAAVWGHGIRFTANRDEILGPVRSARVAGLRHVIDLDDDLVLAVATAIAMRQIDRGRITSLTTEPPTVTLEGDENRVYRLDEAGGALLFIDP